MYQGFFINLDRNEERRRALTQHLEERGVASRYRRVAAIDGHAVAGQYPTQLNPGELGLWLSHLKLLEAARGANVHLHLIEDDTILVTEAAEQFDRILECASEQLGDWDLIYTDTYVEPGEVGLFRDLSRLVHNFLENGNLSLVDLNKVPYFACASSFFINKQAVDKYASLLADQWSGKLPIDIYLRNLVQEGQLKAYLTVPFATSVSRDSLQSDIRGDLDTSRVATTIYRRAFFRDADLQSLDAEMQELIQGIPRSPMTDIYLKILIFKLSDRWAAF